MQRRTKGRSKQGPTVGVLGCGIDVVYPRRNRGLFHSVRRHGALISEYYLGEAPSGMAIPGQKPHHSRPCRYRSDRGGARA